MLKKTFKIIVAKYGKPLHIGSHGSPHYWCDDQWVEISWGLKKNKQIAKDFLGPGRGYIVTWRSTKPININFFRARGSKVSAEQRAKDYIDKLNRWANE